MKIDENKIEQKPVKIEKKPLDKNVILLVSLVVIFFLAIAFIFNLEDDTQVQMKEENKQNISQFDTNKINQIKEQKEKATLIKEVREDIKKEREENKQNISQFDTNKIEEIENKQTDKEQEIKNDNLEVLELKNKIAELEKEIRYLKYSQNKPQAQELHQDKKDQEQIIKDEMKKYLKSINNFITIRDYYFSYDGKNYYIGDVLNNYKVKDIRKNDIRFCNSNWCYTLRNYK
jgi:uncharacterized small protein (DUF1192 family)